MNTVAIDSARTQPAFAIRVCKDWTCVVSACSIYTGSVIPSAVVISGIFHTLVVRDACICTITLHIRTCRWFIKLACAFPSFAVGMSPRRDPSRVYASL